MPKVTLEWDELITVLTQGSPAEPIGVPKSFADQIKAQVPELVFEELTTQPNCVMIWSQWAWDNELKRRAYLETITNPAHEHRYPVAPISPPRQVIKPAAPKRKATSLWGGDDMP